MSPIWYYTSSSIGGFINWITLALSSLSDVMPKQWRAPCFGVLLSGFSLGFAFAPILALAFSHLGVSILSLSLSIFSFIYGIIYLPETLPIEASERARLERTIRGRTRGRCDTTTTTTSTTLNGNVDIILSSTDTNNNNNNNGYIDKYVIFQILTRPIRELSILNRDTFFRLLSALAFFSGMSTSADQTLLLYYVEDRLGFNDRDVATLFMILGILGIFVQGVVLKQLTDCLREKRVVVLAFAFGALHNTLYAFAESKRTIFVGVAVGTLTGMSFPTISAMKSNNVEEHEQGRIQGALYALSSLAGAIGPILLRSVYSKTKDTKYPGSFFMVATLFYTLATFFATALPKKRANSSMESNHDSDTDTSSDKQYQSELIASRRDSFDDTILL
eukprot:CAMPEP_0184860354 /NCGR_PEP_ID=MMETSP0580-20130426/5254_1 /TAXON_ID=1118495 /ORGANISM="Dactyliosolen fragilissimus" /LENGTH=389 /DNA_ID=CAMNT_0027357423 /DNA_START=426 /DNA_END=1595 /DNA_ORIENTATION=+